MSEQLQQRLNALSRQPELLRNLNRGIEREALRVDHSGDLARTPHPPAFGSALTHPQITTDFSEALLELVTPVATRLPDTIDQLDAIHRLVHGALGDELLWPGSMPCKLGADADIPVAWYGSSHVAQMKRRYRFGLVERYNPRMQTIAGIHYNFSPPEALWPLLQACDGNRGTLREYTDAQYFAAIRNFRRVGWVLLYCFGASPAICRSFLTRTYDCLEPFTSGTLHLPYGTSLRMGGLGYQSDAQAQMQLTYNDLDNYIAVLREAILTPHPDYRGIPADRQLRDGLLQIENELYSPIRPKRRPDKGEAPVRALKRGGVEYLEVRCIDLDPALPTGIDAAQMRFLDALLLYCLLQHSPPLDIDAGQMCSANFRRVVDEGRRPGLELQTEHGPRPLKDWGHDILDGVDAVAALLDEALGGEEHRRVCAWARAALDDPEQTISARQLRTLREEQTDYALLMMDYARRHHRHFLDRPLTPSERDTFEALRAASEREQAEAEARNTESFEAYLARYYEQYDMV